MLPPLYVAITGVCSLPVMWLLLGFAASPYSVPIAVGDLLAGRSVRGSPRQSRYAKRAEYALLVANKGPL